MSLRVTLTFVLFGWVFSSNAQKLNILFNQVAYYPQVPKIALIRFSPATSFSILKQPEGTVVYIGNLSQAVNYQDASDSLKIADFGPLRDTGKYVIQLNDGTISLPFYISNRSFRDLSYASLRSYYYQRCSYELTETYAGIWKRNAGHPDTAVIYHSSTGRTGKDPSPKGWYDAGDYNKYVVNAGISVGTLLQFYELFPHYFSDGTASIPESGNGINDLLDEVKFELDWLLTMQDTDGGVFHKVTTENFCGYVMPDMDKAPRYFVGKGTAATLDFAAMMAMAARIYKPIDSVFANDCLQKAKKAWLWAVNHPNVPFKNPSGIYTGEYGDNTFTDEFIWAAAELYISSADSIYKGYLLNNIAQLTNYNVPSWPNVAALGLQSLATVPNGLDTNTKNQIKEAIIQRCNKLKSEIDKHPARITNTGFFWGCNGTYAQAGVCLIYGYILSNDSSYLYAASELADYLLGKNVTGYSFFTGYGFKPIMDPHQRVAYADKIKTPIPGFLSGGPNPGRQDNAKYAYLAPAKSFVDHVDSYASNEVAINWNAPATFLLAALDDIWGIQQPNYKYNPTLIESDLPPFFTLSRPIFGTNFKSNDSITIKFSFQSPVNQIKEIEIYLNSRFLTKVEPNITEFNIAPLPVGEHVIAVCAIGNNGMVSEKNTRFKVKSASRIKFIKKASHLNIYPNPADNNVTVEFIAPETGQVQINFTDLNGKILHTENLYAEKK